MRKYAWLSAPQQADGHSGICRIMLHEAEEGLYLFLYDSPEAVQCVSDRFYDTSEALYEEWNGLIDARGWIAIEDPLPDCQHDAPIPLRVKGRADGRPEWGQYETLRDGEWVPYTPPCSPGGGETEG